MSEIFKASCRVKSVIGDGGGSISSGRPFLGSRATHVVCYPEAAAKWLAIGAPTCPIMPAD